MRRRATALLEMRAYRLKHAEELRLYKAAWHMRNKERLAAKKATYRKMHAVRIAAKKAADYRANSEGGIVRARAYRAGNRDHCNAVIEQWRVAHPENVRRSRQAYRTRAMNRGTYTIGQWEEILLCHQYRCAHCGTFGPLDIDHILPISKGGANTWRNLQPLCRSCNSVKGARIPQHLIEVAA